MRLNFKAEQDARGLGLLFRVGWNTVINYLVARRSQLWRYVGFSVMCGVHVFAWGEAAAALPDSYEEIIVTAQKRSQSVDEVPIAISVFSGEQLRALGVSDTRQLGSLVPGFTVSDSGFNTPVFTLRGVGFNDTTYTASSTVGVYQDEFSLPFSIMTKGLALDLDRVEVLKGPQGIFYGRNTTGGAVNFIANAPTDEAEASVQLGLGRFRQSDVSALVSGRLGENTRGRLALRDRRSQQGWQYSNTRPGDTLGREDRQALRAILDWQAAETLSFQFALNAWSDRSEPQAAQVIYYDPQLVGAPPQRAETYPFVDPDTDDNRVADWPAENGEPFAEWQLDDHFRMGSIRLEWQLAENVLLTSLLSHIKMESLNSKIAQTGFDFDNSEQNISAQIKTTAWETRLSGELNDDAVNWMVGLNYSRDSGHEYHSQFIGYQSAALASPDTGGRSLSDKIFFTGDNRITQLAGFFNLQWYFAPDFSLSVGARQTRQEQQYAGCSGDAPDAQPLAPGQPTFGQAIFPTVSQATAAAYEERTGEAGDPQYSYTPGECMTVAENGSFDRYSDVLDEENTAFRAAVDWQPSEGRLWYLSVGQGYKAGSYPVLTAASQAQLEPVTQEKVVALELGTKQEYFSGQLRQQFAVYDYRYTDKQLLAKTFDPIFGPLPVLQNVPESEVKGGELGLQYLPAQLSGLALSFSLAYVDTKVVRYRGYNTDGSDPDFDYAGRRFNFAPLWEYQLTGAYQWQLESGLQVFAAVDYSFTDETNSTLDGNPKYRHDDAGLWGGRIALSPSGRKWELTLYARNITDEFTTVSVFKNGDGISRMTGRPRNYGLSLAYHFL